MENCCSVRNVPSSFWFVGIDSGRNFTPAVSASASTGAVFGSTATPGLSSRMKPVRFSMKGRCSGSCAVTVSRVGGPLTIVCWMQSH